MFRLRQQSSGSRDALHHAQNIVSEELFHGTRGADPTIDKHRLISYMGRMSPKDLEEIAEAVEAYLGFDLPDSIEAP